ncbi:O-antigen ligase family protein [Spirosoma arcticum]
MNGYVQELRASIDRQTVLFALLGAVSAVGAGFIIAHSGMKGIGLLLTLPIVGVVVALCLYQPKLGLFIYVQFSFVVNGISRFSPVQAPFGLLADGLLVLVLLGVLLNARRSEWGRLHNPVFYLVLLWFLYTLLELFNPEAAYPMAWVFGIRLMSFYWIQLTILTLLLIRTKKDINQLINLWLIWSVLAAVWAFKQRYIGLTGGEQAWLDEGAGITHVLFGHLRCFSFYSDAGQFGVEMAYAALLCIIKVLEDRSVTRKFIFLLIGIIVFWGYALSGTRGALFVVLVGFPVYLLLRRNLLILSVGVLVGVAGFGLLKYTSAGSGSYDINRMRSALNPEESSFQVRLDNQKKLADYLATRPFGCGIGSSSDLAKRFTPGSFLAQTPPDSWFVKVWTETGIVGLLLHIGSLLYFFGVGAYRTMRVSDPDLQSMLLALLCGYVGVLAASYGNPVFGQFPTNSIMSVSIVLLCTGGLVERKGG